MARENTDSRPFSIPKIGSLVQLEQSLLTVRYQLQFNASETWPNKMPFMFSRV
jgi:hypothetical protein